jgi:hypothetical protein
MLFVAGEGLTRPNRLAIEHLSEKSVVDSECFQMVLDVQQNSKLLCGADAKSLYQSTSNLQSQREVSR